MKFIRFPFLIAVMLLISCQNNDGKRLAEQQKDAKEKELIFNTIEKGWSFSTPSLTPVNEVLLQNWTSMHLFLSELAQKPKSSIGAFQKKAAALSKKVTDLNNNIPVIFNKPEIKSRIAVLATKIHSINLFINLDDIPHQKVVTLVADANEELQALYQQMDEIVRKTSIPKEEGETDMIRMLDTARAIKSPITQPLNKSFKKLK